MPVNSRVSCLLTALDLISVINYQKVVILIFCTFSFLLSTILVFAFVYVIDTRAGGYTVRYEEFLTTHFFVLLFDFLAPVQQKRRPRYYQLPVSHWCPLILLWSICLHDTSIW